MDNGAGPLVFLNGHRKFLSDTAAWGIRALMTAGVIVGWKWCGKVDGKFEQIAQKASERDISWVRLEGYFETQTVTINEQGELLKLQGVLLDRIGERQSVMADAMRTLTAESIIATREALKVLDKYAEKDSANNK